MLFYLLINVFNDIKLYSIIFQKKTLVLDHLILSYFKNGIL